MSSPVTTATSWCLLCTCSLADTLCKALIYIYCLTETLNDAGLQEAPHSQALCPRPIYVNRNVTNVRALSAEVRVK